MNSASRISFVGYPLSTAVPHFSMPKCNPSSLIDPCHFGERLVDLIDDGLWSIDVAMTRPLLAFLETDPFAQPIHFVGIPTSQAKSGYIVPIVVISNPILHVLSLPNAGS